MKRASQRTLLSQSQPPKKPRTAEEIKQGLVPAKSRKVYERVCLPYLFAYITKAWLTFKLWVEENKSGKSICFTQPNEEDFSEYMEYLHVVKDNNGATCWTKLSMLSAMCKIKWGFSPLNEFPTLGMFVVGQELIL